MKVYFSGISGTGIGPLAELAYDAGYEVCGSDMSRGAIADEIEARGIKCSFGAQDGVFLNNCQTEGVIDWLVYTSALPQDHPEILKAKELGIHISKRDGFLADLIDKKSLKMIAVAGTHGKTTTTSMLVWAFKQLRIPCAYLVGTTLGWAKGAEYTPEAKYFIYEADEYDRNFLAYHPYVSAITCVDYDHPDIYPSIVDYQNAFAQFESQSYIVVKNTTFNEKINLIGELRRQDANLALEVIKKIRENDDSITCSDDQVIDVLNRFPGAGRRFEEITSGVISDYGHHPKEIKATVEMAHELRDRDAYSGLAVIYQPHQNTRQHKMRDEYIDAFIGADKILWLPTFLTREDESLRVIEPSEFIASLKNAESAEVVEMNDVCAEKLKQLHQQNWLILLLSAGPADSWYREIFKN